MDSGNDLRYLHEMMVSDGTIEVTDGVLVVMMVVGEVTDLFLCY